ncbi:Glycosyltransferase involved in cell wall bisynthesis [Algoriphagus locisalis]|uniref:Glycosyltransferase involved in cell wall bisynthesis n=1 Tax=Algoriphagus locisalis TaxID=305507 RepID=A0A1I6XQL4_9BACT|nr:glycosyltransferase [Algoriphagus locisalis]SFT40373.1 Glycosyltransferase involved in cell wall bisynthesis [Algoriphagus locisalis]
MAKESRHMPKIIQLVDSLSMGGTERMSVNIANYLLDFGVESGLIITRESGGLEQYLKSSVKKRLFSKKGKLDLITFYRIVVLLRTEAPDVLHAHQTSIFWAVLLKFFLPRTKLIWHDHFGMSEKIDQYPRKEMNLLIGSIDVIITVNEKIKSYWQNRFPSMRDKVYYIENFSGNISEELTRKKKDQFRIINIANFRKQKDQLTLLRALVGLKEKIGDFKAYFLGEYVEIDWKEKIQSEIIRLGLEEQVQIVGPVNNVAPYIEMAHIGILSSESEGLPVALLEYGMGALPTIATDVGQCGDVLGHGQFGELVPAKSPEKLHQAILKICADYPQAALQGQQFKKHVEVNYGYLNFFNKYLPIALPELKREKISSIPV